MQAPVRIYDTNMNRVAHLENVFDLSYELPLNELWTASFSLPKDDPKAMYVQPFYYAEIFDGTRRVDLFRMMPQEITRNDQAFSRLIVSTFWPRSSMMCSSSITRLGILACSPMK